MIIASAFVITACVVVAWGIRAAEKLALEIPRVAFSSDVLAPVDIETGEPVTFLLVGSDSAEGLDPDDPRLAGRNIEDERNGQVRADTIMLVRLDPRTTEAAVVGIPRDLYVPIPGTPREWRINTALAIGGPEKLVETIDLNFGVEVNHYVQVDFAGFADLIDAIGGISVWTDSGVRDRESGFWVGEGGCHRLDGDMALAYVRGREFERYDEDEDRWRRIDLRAGLDRNERQQDFLVLALEAAVNQGGRNPAEIKRLIDAGIDAVTLDQVLTPDDLNRLANSFSDFEPERLRRYNLPVYDVWVPRDSEVQEIENPTAEDRAEHPGDAVLRMRSGPAQEVLDVFRGEGGFLDIEDVQVAVSGTDSELVSDARDFLAERGFAIDTDTAPSGSGRTVIRFSPGEVDEAILLGRFIVPTPEFELVPDEFDEDDELVSVVELAVGDDYEGVAFIPGPVFEVEQLVYGEDVSPTTPTTRTTPTSASPAPTTTESPTTTTEAPVLTIPSTTIAEILGRPPEGVSCS
ncbi:MAG: LCP family protein [Acidimicrobiales bacterium]|nr:LCP family protein [Acidimicrobiales bacterium]